MKKLNQILRTLSRSKLFLSVNVLGMAIALAVAIMLLLFVVNELNYDKHFTNSERIVRLNSIWQENGETVIYPICLRKAYTELPSSVPGIEAAVQLLRGGEGELMHDKERFQGVKLLFADAGFFRMFEMKVIDGQAETALDSPYNAVITDKRAKAIFGTTQAVGQQFTIGEHRYTVSAVVAQLPSNTHFHFDILVSMVSLGDFLGHMQGLEFFTYYLLDAKAPFDETCHTITQSYTNMLTNTFGTFGGNKSASVEKLTDLHLRSEARFNLEPQGSMSMVRILAGLALLILLLAVTNFVNLFVVQAEMRMVEVGVRKVSGGSVVDLAVQFFVEASMVVLVAFALGIVLSYLSLPYFASLIGTHIDVAQLYNPSFLLGLLVLVVLVILCSAGYPAFYLSRLNPMTVLMRRSHSSKRRLTAGIVIFQSMLTIVLVSVILTIGKQTNYMQNIPLGYNPTNVMILQHNNKEVVSHNEALKEMLQKTTGVEQVGFAQHIVGSGASGQGISLSEAEQDQFVNQYRVTLGMCEVMQFELIEGRFFVETDLARATIILNEATTKMLDMQPPFAGQFVNFQGTPTEVVGVVHDFYYDSPGNKVQPLALSPVTDGYVIYIRFDKTITRPTANQLVMDALLQFDPAFVLNAQWSEDINAAKFESEKRFSRIVTNSTLLSLLIAMLGLLAIHSYTALRRTKEIGIRRVNGATVGSIFTLLSLHMFKWIAIAGCLSIPIAYYICSNWLSNYANHIPVDAPILLLPVLLQALLALLTTWGVSMKVSSQNPVDALRKE